MNRLIAAVGIAALVHAPGHLGAQTDYYNTDEGRPVRIEDAFPVERYAFELQLAPVRLERESGGVYHWEMEPELAYGIFPRTHVEVGFPLQYRENPEGDGVFGLAGLSFSALHNLNAETSIPALAVGAEVTVPVGGFAADRAYTSLTGIATKTFGFARFHANGQVTLGSSPDEGEDAGEASRWMAGLAVDKAFPLKAVLVTADVFAEEPLGGGNLAWTAEAGIRYQTSPQFNLDLGVGRRFAGEEQGWFFTFGLARAFALRSLIPIR
jgi:hypothetical protein